MKLVYRLLLFSLALITNLLVLIVVIVGPRLQARLIDERAAELGREAQLVAGQWTSSQDPQELARRASAALGGRVTLINSDGAIVADAATGALHAEPAGTPGRRPEVARAVAANTGVVAKPRAELRKDELYVAVQAPPHGTVRVGVHTATLNAIFDNARRDVIIAGLIAFAWAVLFALLFASYVSGPVIKLRDMAQALARGEVGVHPRVSAPGEVGDLSESLEHLSTRLENLESVRRDFIANVSHELNSPLTIASGFAATLARQDPPEESRRQFARAILSNTRRMQRVIDDMLDLSRIESGGWIPRSEEIPVDEVIGEVFESVGPTATEKGITLRMEIDPRGRVVWADRTALRQIIANLTENSIRHTHHGGIVVFSERTADGTWVGVRDTGEGMAPQHLPRIFERLYRADRGRARKSGGSGLGLAIVKHLAEAHGGGVDAESAVGVGTTIRAFIPLVPGARKAQTAALASARMDATTFPPRYERLSRRAFALTKTLRELATRKR